MSVYKNSKIYLTSKHQKSVAIAPAFKKILMAEVIACELDTDQLGTFSGEVERKGSALNCARQKCAWGLDSVSGLYGLSSEGSFGPHPQIPFVASDYEILYFVDRERGFEIYESMVSEKTNYHMDFVSSIEALHDFAKKALFPSHALIIKAAREDYRFVAKGLSTHSELEVAFHEAQKKSKDGSVWVETDMRAHVNPSRMRVIGSLAEKLAHRLLAQCPLCDIPGWGFVRSEPGLPCEQCGEAARAIKADVFGCVSCSYLEARGRALEFADPSVCDFCNP